MSSVFPGSRAPGTTRDARISNEEDQARRLFEAAGKDNWLLSTLPLGLDLTDQAVLTADKIRLYYLGKIR